MRVREEVAAYLNEFEDCERGRAVVRVEEAECAHDLRYEAAVTEAEQERAHHAQRYTAHRPPHHTHNAILFDNRIRFCILIY